MTGFPSGQDVLAGGRKTCARCREVLPLESFAPRPKLGSGFSSWCLPCTAAYHRDYRAKRKVTT